MKKRIQVIRGMNDCLPDKTGMWQRVENSLKKVLNSYGYSEIRFPLLEKTSLFEHAIGTVTDVTEKEMYTFKDRNGDSLTLRPEGTTGCVRASIEHALLYKQEQRLWYIGPMFRHERPQKGRYRQFNQLGVEVFGLRGPDIDAELIILASRWWKELGISNYLSLELNSIGSPEERARYCDALVLFLERHKEKLDEDCRRRIYKNPLRILDSKNPNVQDLLNDAPLFSDYLNDSSREHFHNLCRLLKEIGIDYNINQRLVRGLDYYNDTVFEWVTTNLGAQDTVCAGGRYDGLVERLGGYATPAVGFAIGLERLILLIQTVNSEFKAEPRINIYIISSCMNTKSVVMKFAEHVRDRLPYAQLVIGYGNNLKKQFSLADRRGASFVLVLGEPEIESGEVVIKDMCSRKQIKVMQANAIEHLHILISQR